MNSTCPRFRLRSLRVSIRGLGGVAAAPLMLAFVSSASAQTVSRQVVPPTLDPNRLRDNLEKAPEPVPAAPPVIQIAPEQVAPDTAATTRFTLREVRLDGATVIPTDRLMREWDKKPGDEISVEDVFRFANAITRAYSRAGYAISFGVVPQQKIEDGVVTIRVVEGFVSRIDFTGAKLPSGLLGRGPVADIAERIRQSRPLRNADLERYLLLINDVPGVSARATLSPAPDVVGGSIYTCAVGPEERSIANKMWNAGDVEERAGMTPPTIRSSARTSQSYTGLRYRVSFEGAARDQAASLHTKLVGALWV